MILLDVDPSVVKPGWTALIITLVLALAIAALMISMRRQMRKVRVPYRDEVDPPAAEGETVSAPAGETVAQSVSESSMEERASDRESDDAATEQGTAGEPARQPHRVDS